MKKKSLLWICALMLAGLSSCSKDDVQEFGDINNKENFIGTWHLLHHSNGWGMKEDYEAGEVSVTFTKNGEMQVINKRDDQRPFPTGKSMYSFVDIEKSIFTGEPRTCISFGFLFTYSYTFEKGFLYLSQEAYDGDSYTFRLAGCSRDDEPLLNQNWKPNTLLINSENADIEEYSVTNNHFYIDKMPILDNNGPRFIFHCGIEKSLDLRELIIRIIGVKQDIDAFQVGETFQLNQFNASLMPIEECGTTPAQFRATKGSIKLVDKKKAGDKDVLTFQINDLAFEKGYTINGIVDFEYEGTVY